MSLFSPVFANSVITISIPDNLDNFPVHTAEIGCDDVIGCVATDNPYVRGCYTGDNQSREWEIDQWKNEQSLCLDTNNAPFDTECQGADWAKETMTERACYWKNQKKVHFTVNNMNFSNNGCGANSGQLGNEPGGYGLMLMSGINHRSDFFSSYQNYTLGNLDKLFISTSLSIDYLNDQLGQCTPPCDPVAQSCSPIAFVNFNVITHKFAGSSPSSWEGTQFYSVGLSDNRPNLIGPDVAGVNCQLPTTTAAGTFVNSYQSIAFYGQAATYPGQGSKFYEIDVLSQVKKYIAQCEQQLHGVTNPDFNNFMIDAVFFSNEVYNKAIMSYTLTDPKIRLEYKTGFTPAHLPGDINRDRVINIFDYNLLVQHFGNTSCGNVADVNGNCKVDIFDYNLLVQNFGKTQ